MREWAGWQFEDRPSCDDCRWIYKGKQQCATCTRYNELTVQNIMAVDVWLTIRPHAAEIDCMGGVTLPLRHEAMLAEADRHPDPGELLWRLRLIDGIYVRSRNAEREKQRAKEIHKQKGRFEKN